MNTSIVKFFSVFILLSIGICACSTLKGKPPKINRGNTYTNAENDAYDKKIKEYSKAIAIDQTNAVTYYNRGLVYSAKGEYDEAIKDYSRAIAIDPKYSAAYYGRGMANQAKGEHGRAAADILQSQIQK